MAEFQKIDDETKTSADVANVLFTKFIAKAIKQLIKNTTINLRVDVDTSQKLQEK